MHCLFYSGALSSEAEFEFTKRNVMTLSSPPSRYDESRREESTPSLTVFLLSFFFQSGGDDEPMSDNDAMSREGDSPIDALSRVPAGDVDPETLDKLRRQESFCHAQLNYNSPFGRQKSPSVRSTLSLR